MVQNPNRTLLWMSVFFLIVALACLALLEPLMAAFFANPVFNGMILLVLLIGIIVNFRHVVMLRPELAWLDDFRRGDARQLEPPERGLLASAARILTRRGGRIRLSAQTMRALLEGIRMRLDESRDLSRYVVGLLIFLGLLGTFWGLLDTLQAISRVIGGLSASDGGFATFFDDLKAGLAEPLAGMGTAFSSSLFGLAGALVLGFFDLQAGHAQNRFYNELEEWMAGLTHVSGGPVLEEEPIPVYVQALLEQTADSLDKLQRVVHRSEEQQRSAGTRTTALASQITQLVEELRSEQRQLGGLMQGQADLPLVLSRLSQELAGLRELNQDLRHHLGNIDGNLGALMADLPAGRVQALEEIRNEIRLLARTMSRGRP